MTPRKASLRVAHQKGCPNASKTTADSVRGCKCKPSYYTFHRGRDGRPIKGPRVRDKQTAERALRKLQVEIDEGRTGQAKPSDKTFDEWAAEYLEIIVTDKKAKAATVAAYGPTIRYARPVFGNLSLREIGHAELRRLVAEIRADEVDEDGNIVRKGGGDATVSKHLRHVGAIFQSAVDHELIAANPVTKFKKNLRLTIPGGVESFTDPELARLWTSMAALEVEDVYVTISKAAVTTGCRQGELIGADLGDLDLLNGVLHVRHHYDRTAGVQTLPKDNEARDVHLIPSAVALFEGWIAKHGNRGDTEPIFVAPRSGGRINGQYLSRVVERALEKANPPIPKLGQNGRPRKPFHAFRSSFDRICRERGQDLDWIRRELGHSDPRLTLNTYGEPSEADDLLKAASVESIGFPV